MHLFIKKHIRIIAISILIIVALIPHRQPCGAPGHTCVSAPDEHGIYTSFDDIQPSIVSAVEYVLDTDMPVYYRRDMQHISIN